MCYAPSMKNFLHHFPQKFILGLTVVSCIGVYPANLIQPASLEPSADTTFEFTENPDPPDSITHPSITEPEPTNPSEDDDNEDDEPFDFQTDLIIYALNPGYTKTTDAGKFSNSGEFIELLNLTGDTLDLSGYSLVYTNGGGKDSTLFTFPEESYLIGDHLLLRYSKSPESDLADLNYKSSLALKAGPLKLIRNGEITDQVCWTGGAECQNPFTSSKPETLTRNLITGDFDRVLDAEYLPDFDLDHPRLILPEEPDPDDETDDPEEEIKPAPHCQGLQFSELLTYYAEDKSEQFIEIFNPTGVDIALDDCKISYKNKTYELAGNVASGGYFAYYPSTQFSLTKNPKNPLTLAIIDADDSVVDEISYPNGQKKSTSYARTYDAAGNELWQITYAITPGSENIYQEFRTCESGKVINEATGNCVKVTTLKSAATSLKDSALAPCPAGKYRNPLTGRCKNISSSTSTPKECAEGYERNPETNRCRKVKSATSNDGAEYALVPKTSTSHSVFIGIGIVALIILLGITYVVLQFRHEIARAARKARQRLNRIRQDLLSRRIGRNRDQKS